ELKAGRVDVVRDVAVQELGILRSDPNLQVVPRPAFGIAALGFGMLQRPFDDRAVRRAIAMGLNRAGVVAALTTGDTMLASQLVLAGMLGYDDTVTEFVKYDEAGARKALADAGVALPLVTELWYPTQRSSDVDLRRVAEAFAADLLRIGIQ